MIADPFPHQVIDGLVNSFVTDGALNEFRWLRDRHPDAWQRYENAHERKLAMTFGRAQELGAHWCAMVGRFLASPLWITDLERITGLPGLSFDDLGGGLHLIEPGGFLDVHVDFNRHQDGRYRRVNVLLYLCETGAGGELELWRDASSGPVVTITPAPGRLALFLTGETSWHGHPHPLQGDRPRCSLAAYYYTTTPPPAVADPHSTIFLGA